MSNYQNIAKQIDEAILELDEAYGRVTEKYAVDRKALVDAKIALIGGVPEVKAGKAPAKARKANKKEHLTNSERRTRRLDKVAANRKARKDQPHRGDRKAEILELTKQGHAPKQIAQELGTHVNYVYLVRRNALKAAA